MTFMPGVVEPSFGIDRILFSLLEHSYYARPKEEGEGDKQIRAVLKFSQLGLLGVSNRARFLGRT